jgi:hypothetical protein
MRRRIGLDYPQHKWSDEHHPRDGNGVRQELQTHGDPPSDHLGHPSD